MVDKLQASDTITNAHGGSAWLQIDEGDGFV